MQPTKQPTDQRTNQAINKPTSHLTGVKPRRISKNHKHRFRFLGENEIKRHCLLSSICSSAMEKLNILKAGIFLFKTNQGNTFKKPRLEAFRGPLFLESTSCYMARVPWRVVRWFKKANKKRVVDGSLVTAIQNLLSASCFLRILMSPRHSIYRK